MAAVCALATRLGVDVVAEGVVEDRDFLPTLTELGCGYAQRYALARPLTSARVTAAFVTQGQRWRIWIWDSRRSRTPKAGAR